MFSNICRPVVEYPVIQTVTRYTSTVYSHNGVKPYRDHFAIQIRQEPVKIDALAWIIFLCDITVYGKFSMRERST